METIIGKDDLKQKMGIGIANNLELAAEEALSSFEPANNISINIIGPDNLMLQETTKCLEKIRSDYDFDTLNFSVSLEKELYDKYAVIICNEGKL